MATEDFANLASACVEAFKLDAQIRIELRTFGDPNATTRVRPLTGTTVITCDAIRSRSSEMFTGDGMAAGEGWHYDLTAEAYGDNPLPRGEDHVIENYGTASQRRYIVRSAERLCQGQIVRVYVGQNRTLKK